MCSDTQGPKSKLLESVPRPQDPTGNRKSNCVEYVAVWARAGAFCSLHRFRAMASDLPAMKWTLGLELGLGLLRDWGSGPGDSSFGLRV